ncbi:MAG: S8 family serine peptidase [Oligoflexia bacterium]|nr:S8 family serine peptidase [Oligoflexia bacterium]
MRARDFAFLGVLLTASTLSAGEVIKFKTETLRLNDQSINQKLSGTEAWGTRFAPTAGRQYYIVQFTEPVRPVQKQRLERAGIKFHTYVPDDAFIVRVTETYQWAALNAQANVRAVVPYSVRLRLSEHFKYNSQRQAVLVRAFKDAPIDSLYSAAKLFALDLRIEKVAPEMFLVDANGSAAKAIANLEGVEFVEPAPRLTNFLFENDDTQGKKPSKGAQPKGDYSDLTGYESGTKLMNFDAAYARGLSGQGQKVAVADTGLDVGNSQLLLKDFQGQLDSVYALGFFGITAFQKWNLPRWSDPQGHGTHVSGSVVGNGALSGGRIRGGAYGAKLVFEHLWNALLNNIFITPDFNKLFVKAHVEKGATVHSNSWGAARDLGSYDMMSSKVDDVAWNNPDLLIVFAAGNSGQDLDRDGHIDPGSVSSPGTAKNVLTVGASKNLANFGGIQEQMKGLRDGARKWGVEPLASSRLSDNPGGMAAFSSVGPTRDGRIKPEIVAPGTNIVSLQSQHKRSSKLWGAYNQHYAYAGGTSMATPLTSGAAAVSREYLQSIGVTRPSAALLKASMLHTAFDLFPGQFGFGKGQEFQTPRPNTNEGFGRVDLEKMVTLKRENLIDEREGLATGGMRNYQFYAKQGQKIQVTLVYTDAPGSAGAAQALVNDLDLSVVDQGGDTFFPNRLKAPDKVNNTEMIEMVAPHDGEYTVRISAQNVPVGRPDTNAQPYALVFTLN